MELEPEIINQVAEMLKARSETIAVAESTTGGLISARLLSVPGASAYFLGGTVIYTRASRKVFLTASAEDLQEVKPMTEEMAHFFAARVREKLTATWGIAELGIAGPSGSAYGIDAGTSVIAVSGPTDAAITINTRQSDRAKNMEAFTDSACQLLCDVLQASPE
jgi:PncC family amidohydrolase